MLIAFANAEYDVAKYCQLVETGTKLPSMNACQTYYICGPGGQPIQANCTDGTVFSKNAQNCVAEANSNCYFGLNNPCENRDKEFAPNTKACNQWYYCVKNEIAGSGSCAIGQIFSASSGTCVYGHCESGGNGNGYTDVQNVCQIMSDGMFFGDNEQCNAWHKCNGMMKTSGDCRNQLVYDAKSGQCLKNDGNMCDRTGGVGSSQAGGPPNDSTCTEATVVKLVGDKQVCSVYYSCELVATGTAPKTYKWLQKKCTNQYFDVISQQCTSTSSARPYPHCNRCEFTTGNTYWVNDFSVTCSEFNTCKNGQMISNGNQKPCCPEGYYFNEPAQYCVDTNLNEYIQNHGACQNYSCTKERVCTVAVSPPVVPPAPASGDTSGKNPPPKSV
ncbi:peritrophin-48-like [Calliphora vicina]|uniref:peritrophin-48-like n=1 Tax=Calliphora vicina TaxID=7373 RepID=UPI00325A5B85